ncbi:MAG: response regulator [Desulfatibacillaceae bacterium]
MNVLIVDDEKEMIELVQTLLEDHVDRFHTAYNGKEALEQLHAHHHEIDAVITDYVMEDVDGMELLKSVRDHYGALPVIMMTGHGEKNLVIQALRHHCNGFLEKPFTRRQLLAELERARVDVLMKARPSEYSRIAPYLLDQMNSLLSDVMEAGRMAMDQRQAPGTAPALMERIMARIENMERVSEKISRLSERGEDSAMESLKPVYDKFVTLVDELKVLRERCAGEKTCDVQPPNGSTAEVEDLFRNLLNFAVQALSPARHETTADEPAPQLAPEPEPDPRKSIIEAQISALRDEIENRAPKNRDDGGFMKV